MTDKKDINQDKLTQAFEQLNQTEGLQPSAELDAMILQMAEDELGSVVEDKSDVADITDISFRRGRRESHNALKKKGLFPNWMMPMGLAATVLLSFGVINRVLLSPEFDNLTKQSSYEAVSDELIPNAMPSPNPTSHTDSLELSELERESIGNDEESITAKAKNVKSEKPRTSITFNGSQIDADISSENPPSVDRTSPNRQDDSYIVTERNNGRLNTMEVESRGLINSTDSTKSQTELEKRFAQELEAENQKLIDDSQKKRAELDKLNLEAKMQNDAMKDRVEESNNTIDQTFVEKEQDNVVASPPRPSSEASASLQDEPQMASEPNMEAGIEATASEVVSEESPAYSEFEEIVVTGTRLNSKDIEEILTRVSFEHKQCRVMQDCTLVALECDSCDCLEPVNSENYKKYHSEFSQSEITQQCINTSVDCVRNYCQVQHAE